MNSHHSISKLFLPVLILALLAVVGCEEREGTFIDDGEEIRHYLVTTEEGQELFRVEGFVPTDPYYVGTVEYRDSVIDYRRVVVVDQKGFESDSLTTEFETDVGTGRIAEVTVQDRWEVQVTSYGPNPEDTNVVFHNRNLMRRGLFVKVGDDARPYAGWRLWGYNGDAPLTPANVTITREDGTTFPGDPTTYSKQVYFRLYTNVSPPVYVTTASGEPRPYQTTAAYIPIDEIPLVSNGDTLQITSDFLTGLDRYQLAVYESDTGFVVKAMTKELLEDRYTGTVDTRDNNPRRYNVLYLQQIRFSQQDPEFVTHQGWCVPFRIEQ